MQEWDSQLELALNRWIRTFFEYSYRDVDVDESHNWQIGFRAYPRNLPLDYFGASYNHETGYAGEFKDIYVKGLNQFLPLQVLGEEVFDLHDCVGGGSCIV